MPPVSFLFECIRLVSTWLDLNMITLIPLRGSYMKDPMIWGLYCMAGHLCQLRDRRSQWMQIALASIKGSERSSLRRKNFSYSGFESTKNALVLPGQPLVLWRPPPRGAHESEPWKWGDSVGYGSMFWVLSKVLEGLGLGFEVWEPYRVDMVTLMRYNDVHAFLGLQ